MEGGEGGGGESRVEPRAPAPDKFLSLRVYLRAEHYARAKLRAVRQGLPAARGGRSGPRRVANGVVRESGWITAS